MLQYVKALSQSVFRPPYFSNMQVRQNGEDHFIHFNIGGFLIMSLFNMFKKKKPEDTPAFRMEMAKKIAFHRLRYVTEREGETEIVIGRDGGFNIRNGEFIVSADNRVIFRCNIKDMQASELLSKEGAILTAPDLENGGAVRTIVVYYVYFR